MKRLITIVLLTCCAMLLNVPALAAQGTLPLESPLLAFTAARMDGILLFDMNGEQRFLSFGALEHHVWGFSPDGCRVLLTLAETARPAQAYTARLDGSDLRRLVTYDALPEGEWGVWEPAWSPDGARIAFTMSRRQRQRDGSVLQETHIGWIDGAATEAGPPQFYSVTGREFTPQWSPDGAWLAYVSYDERVPGPDAQSTAAPTSEPPPGQAPPELPTILEADLWVVSADGVTKYRLTDFLTGSMRAPRWSPDGELIGFVYSPSANNDTLWMIANNAGAIPTQLSFVWNLTLDMTWFPDSSAMLVSARDFQGMSENRLWRIPLVGNADTDATLYLTDPQFAHTDYPRFSADGRWLAFRSDYVIIVLDTVMGNWRALAEDMPGNTPPVWSPPGFGGELECD